MKPYYKLVRDKIPQILKNNKKNVIYKKLNTEEFSYYLKLKIKEEINDLIDEKDKNKLIEHLTDIYELLDLFEQDNQINKSKIKKIMSERAKTHGLYNKKIFLILEEN